jgi:hypothetical protein
METATRMNHIFVDYENVPEMDLDLIAGKAVKVFPIVGRQRKSLPTNWPGRSTSITIRCS